MKYKIMKNTVIVHKSVLCLRCGQMALWVLILEVA